MKNKTALQHHQPLLSPTRSATTLVASKSSKLGSSTRVARLASLFSSRSTVGKTSVEGGAGSAVKSSRRKSTSKKQLTVAASPPQEPPSPSKSSATDSFIGWPGTQDKRGSTVAIQSSYDDSSVEPTQTCATRRQQPPSSSSRRSIRSRQPPPQARLTPLERRIVHGCPPQDSSMSINEDDDSDEENPADFALKAVVADALWSPSRPKRALSEVNGRQSCTFSSTESTLSIQDLFGKSFSSQTSSSKPQDAAAAWDSSIPASPSTSSISKDSSLYFSHSSHLQLPHVDKRTLMAQQVVRRQRRPCNTSNLFRAPTEEALKENDRQSPPTHRAYANGRGYCGFLDKTRDVPNLMDRVETDSSSRATSTFSSLRTSNNRDDGTSTLSSLRTNNNRAESDVFDGVDEEEEELSVVMLPTGLAAIQSPHAVQSSLEENRDAYGFIQPRRVETPKVGLQRRIRNISPVQVETSMEDSPVPFRRAVSPTSSYDDSSFDNDSDSEYNPEEDWNDYCISQKSVRKLVRKYRQLSTNAVDAKKAFALLEMRSRIMETDMERGLERRGGTVVVDDLVLTRSQQTSQRIRDAVIVAKAWRDGASPQDVVTAAQLGSNQNPNTQRNWMDDADFMQFKCPSLGPRCMRGFEMFTIGDCQSILLKLTNEHCHSIREELEDATCRQIQAEDAMKSEQDNTYLEGGFSMTPAELIYLQSMEQVKDLSKRLVVAEQAFYLVRDRMEQLVHRYETLLIRIEAESSIAASSAITFDSCSSWYSTEDEDEERLVLQKRAQRAELKAELAARQAMLAQQEAQSLVEEKEVQLQELQQRLLELQSEPNSEPQPPQALPQDSSSSLLFTKAIAAGRRHYEPKTQEERISSVKQKFRDRQRKKRTSSSQSLLLSGEEMYAHLDFYERSLKAVEQ